MYRKINQGNEHRGVRNQSGTDCIVRKAYVRTHVLHKVYFLFIKFQRNIRRETGFVKFFLNKVQG